MADGFLALPLDGMRDMLAASAAFQAWTGAADAEAAAAFVHLVAPDAGGEYPDSEAPHTAPQRHVILNLGKTRRTLAGVGVAGLFHQRIDVEAYFEGQTDPSDRDKSEIPALSFLTSLGAILADLEAASQTGGNLQILTYDLSPPDRIDNSLTGDPGDYFCLSAVFTVGFN